VTILSITAGIAAGIAFSKLAELALANLIGGGISYNFTLSFKAISSTAVLFVILFFLIFLNGIRQVRFAKPIELVKSENFGEKPPKANWFFGVIGVVILAAAYYIAVSIENPVSALVWFFGAVIMVIVATYLVFISGSVLFCRILQKNKNYYYKKNHFVSVSTMVYRMKRNGAGLASICILLTMVLVMISATACLFFGKEDSIRTRYPRDITVSVTFNGAGDANEGNINKLRAVIERNVRKHRAEINKVWDYREAQISGMIEENGRMEVDPMTVDSVDYNKLLTVRFIPLEDYNRMTNQNIEIHKNQALAFALRLEKIPEHIVIRHLKIDIVEQIAPIDVDGTAAAVLFSSLYLVVPDFDDIAKSFDGLKGYKDYPLLETNWYYGFDTDLDSDGQVNLRNSIANELKQLKNDQKAGIRYCFSESLEAEREEFYGLYGGFFFLGIMLSIVFLVAAVLIIYYKQISEGYEDQSRFEIMQKVGMTKKDIRQSINSQMLTVFFLPIAFAVLHLCFAFPIIRKLLMLFSVLNLKLLLVTNGISILIFALFYTVVYRITSNAYYSIVSGAKE
ncbi:MAG TPA: ABC transporter permease, partial [Candidatus Avimonas sp.]|nr:ABC transporter permease [Candidatus Avimonas sp.]